MVQPHLSRIHLEVSAFFVLAPSEDVARQFKPDQRLDAVGPLPSPCGVLGALSAVIAHQLTIWMSFDVANVSGMCVRSGCVPRGFDSAGRGFVSPWRFCLTPHIGVAELRKPGGPTKAGREPARSFK